MEPTAMAEHQAPEAAQAELHTTTSVEMAQRVAHVVQLQTGAVAVAVALAQLVRMQERLAVTAVTDVHHPSPVSPPFMQAVAAVVAATAANQVPHLHLVVTAEPAVAVTVDHQHGTERIVAQAQELVEQQTPVAVAVAAATAHPMLSETITAAVVTAVLESLSCAISYLPLRLPTLQLVQTTELRRLTTSPQIAL